MASAGGPELPWIEDETMSSCVKPYMYTPGDSLGMLEVDPLIIFDELFLFLLQKCILLLYLDFGFKLNVFNLMV